MKFSALFFTSLIVSSLFSVGVLADPPKSIPTKLFKAYVPNGFDDNDQVQVAVAGQFFSGCYRVDSNPKVERDLTAKKITIYQSAYYYEGPCVDVVLPFYQVVTIGILPAGSYTLVDGKSQTTLGTLKINVSKNSGPDDYLYAPVTDAYVKKSTQTSPARVMVSMIFPESCWRLKEIRVDASTPEVLVVQPIAEKVAGFDCVKGEYPIEEEAELLQEKGRYLLHVRSLNGQAINKVVDLY